MTQHLIDASILFSVLLVMLTIVVGPLVGALILEEKGYNCLANFIGASWILLLLFMACFLAVK